METAGLPPAFGREAATVAIEYDGVGDLVRMWADTRDDAERMAIILDIEGAPSSKRPTKRFRRL